MRSSLFLNIYLGSITSAALTTFLHLHNNPWGLSPSAALPYIGRDDTNQARSLSPENTGGAARERGMKNGDLAPWRGCTCQIADAERVPPPATAVDSCCPFLCTHPDACLTCELTQLAKRASNKVNKITSSPLVKSDEIAGQLQCPTKSHPAVPRKHTKSMYTW